jgi:hypothetical protein
VFFKKPLEQIESKSTQSIPMGDHNFPDISEHCLFQKKDELLPSEIESTSNVRYNLMFRISGTHVLFLTLQLVMLFIGRYTAVTVRLAGGTALFQTGNVIEALSRWIPDVPDFPIISPTP